MPDVHAVLSASSSKQWLHCPPSIRLQENFPNESSVYAAEGTFAHEVCEYKVRKYLKERVKRPQSKEFDTEEIEQITDMYAEFVISIIEKMKENGCEPLAFVEERVNYSYIAPSGFGTADMLIIGKDENGKGLLHVVDFKTGKGVFVDADHNSQMMLYDVWERQGLFHVTEGNVVDYNFVRKTINELHTMCNIKEIAADRWNATQLITDLEGDGFTIIPMGMGFKDQSPPMKELYKLLLEGKFIHDGNPVLRWMAGNVVAEIDAAENIKPSKKKSTEKIDGIVAWIMALDRCIRHEMQGSVYDEPDHDLVVI